MRVWSGALTVGDPQGAPLTPLYVHVTAEEGARGEDTDQSSRDYDYLLGMKIWSLTYERIEELKAQLARKEEEFNILYKTEPNTMWLRDLDNLEKTAQVRAPVSLMRTQWLLVGVPRNP